jgi:hypothetical protein
MLDNHSISSKIPQSAALWAKAHVLALLDLCNALVLLGNGSRWSTAGTRSAIPHEVASQLIDKRIYPIFLNRWCQSHAASV